MTKFAHELAANGDYVTMEFMFSIIFWNVFQWYTYNYLPTLCRYIFTK